MTRSCAIGCLLLLVFSSHASAADYVALLDVGERPGKRSLEEIDNGHIQFIDLQTFKVRFTYPIYGNDVGVSTSRNGTFVFCSETPHDPDGGGTGMILFEYDPVENTVVQRYSHPRPPARWFHLGDARGEQSALKAGDEHRAWILTEDPLHRTNQHLECIDLAKGTVIGDYAAPAEFYNVTLFYPVGGDCMVMQTTREPGTGKSRDVIAFMIGPDAKPKGEAINTEIPGGLERALIARDDLVAGAISTGEFYMLRAASNLEAKRLLRLPIGDSNSRVISNHFLSDDDMLVGAGTGGRITTAIVVSMSTGQLRVGPARLAETMRLLFCCNKTMYGLTESKSELVEFDRLMQIVRRSEPMVQFKSAVTVHR